MTPKPALTLLIPGLNEAEHIGSMLDDVADEPWLASLGPRLEVIVVDDGSSDGMADVARTRAGRFARFRVLSLPKNVGKGRALAHGIRESKGDVVAFVDGDRTFELEALGRFYAAIERGAQVVIGNRRSKDSIFYVPSDVIPYIHLRHFVGQRFNTLVRLLTPLRVDDTQCGCKMFSRKAALECFACIEIGGFVFDVEVLLAALERGYRIESLPVSLRYERPEPTSEVFTMSAKVARAFWQVMRSYAARRYAPGALERVSDASADPANDQWTQPTRQRYG